MREFSYARSLVVMRQRWRSRHSICHSRKPHAARKLYGTACYRSRVTVRLLPIEVLHFRNRDSGRLLLPRHWHWPDNLHIRTWPVSWRYTGWAQMNLHQSFQTLSSDRQTGPKFLFNALCFAGGQRCKNDTTAQVHASWIISPVSSVRHESRLQRITVLDLFEAAVFRSDRHIVRLVLQLSVWLMN